MKRDKEGTYKKSFEALFVMARLNKLEFEMRYKIQFNNVIRGHHVYKDDWTPKVGEKLEAKKDTREEAIANDMYAIGLYRGDKLVGHIPIEISSLIYHFLNESTENRIEGMVIGKRMREVGLVVPVEYTAVTTDNMTAIILSSELKKKKEKYKHFDIEILNTEHPCCKTPIFTKEK